MIGCRMFCLSVDIADIAWAQCHAVRTDEVGAKRRNGAFKSCEGLERNDRGMGLRITRIDSDRLKKLELQACCLLSFFGLELPWEKRTNNTSCL